MLKYLIGAVLLVLALYGAVKAWPLIAGPSLSVTSPADYASFPHWVVVGPAVRSPPPLPPPPPPRGGGCGWGVPPRPPPPPPPAGGWATPSPHPTPSGKEA